MTQPIPLVSEVAFGALLTYSPRGTTAVSSQSRTVAYELKSAKPQAVERAVEILRLVLERGELTDFFGPGVVLVPAPRSAPLEPGWLWPGENISRAMVAAGLAKEVLPCLRRIEKVAKSAFAGPGERPSAIRHRDTMAVDPPGLIQPKQVTVVDDVVTKGATLLACASLVKATMPAAEVRVFGLVRTRGLVPDIERIVDPCVGAITWNGSSVDRAP